VAVVPPSGLEAPEVVGDDRIVKPSDNSLHQAYIFYIKVNAWGGSSAFFGPYTLNVGCFNGVVLFNNDLNFITSLPLKVGDPALGVYTFMVPTSTVSYCVIETNEIVNPD